METRIRSLRPPVLEWQAWRGAKLTAIAGASSTVRVRLATGFYVNRTVETSSLPAGAELGAPLAVQVSNSKPSTFTVLAIVGSTWEPGNAPPDEAGDIANDGRWPIIPRHITNTPEEYPWTLNR